jgi:hypothetical protein
LKKSDFADPSFKALIAQYARTPFFAITKYKEPYDDINPSVKVNARELGTLKGAPPEKIAETAAAGLARMFKDYAVEEGPIATRVAGQPAGYIRVRYTMEAGGRQWPLMSEMWVVPRGELVFIIGAGIRQDEKTGTRQEVRRIIDTIKID